MKNSKKQVDIDINGRKHTLNVFFEKRRDCRCSIGAKGIYIRLPLFLNEQERTDKLDNMINWVKGKLSVIKESFKREYPNGGILKIAGTEFIIRISHSNSNLSRSWIIDNQLFLELTRSVASDELEKIIVKLVSKSISKWYLPKLAEKLNRLNKLYFNKKINKISLKDTMTKWGSCSQNGNINICSKLLFAPEDVLDYVCVHELSHLVEMNHSKKFWNIVENIMPNYKEKIKWLKDNGKKCAF